jgi:hypothetical protein
MTVVFHDEDLYTDLKVEAARRHTPASDIVAAAVREWLEQQEDAELLPIIQESRREYEAKGGIPWEEVRGKLLKANKRAAAKSL